MSLIFGVGGKVLFSLFFILGFRLFLSATLRELVHPVNTVFIGTLQVYHELGITCQPGDCNNEHIFRNASQLMADELDLSASLVPIVDEVRALSNILLTSSVPTQSMYKN